MNKNDILELTIEDIGSEGEGIGHVKYGEDAGMAVFVKDTLTLDEVEVKIVKVKKNYAYGRLERIIKPSPYRVEPKCPKARSCGGCSIMHMSYEEQLNYKENKVKNCLSRIGGVQNVDDIMEPICGMDTPYNFRNKMQLPVGVDKNGKVVIGFYAGRTHSIIDLKSCYIGHTVNDFMIRALRPVLQELQDRTGSFIYNEERHEGILRHILTRVGFTTGEIMVCFVINGDELSCDTEKLVQALNEAVAAYNCEFDEKLSITSVSININKEKTNKILGDTCRTLYGRDYITDYIGDVRFNISPMSFYQVNPVQTKVLYDKALSYAELTGRETVWDMYCGIGTISLALAKSAKHVYGVEIVPQAIEDAKTNARINNIDNVSFFCGKAEEVAPRLTDTSPDVVVVDPPRKGCDKILLDTIVLLSPERIVYVSCDVATLARDIAILSESGYAPVKVCAVDQFCHSCHLEVVCRLEKKY